MARQSKAEKNRRAARKLKDRIALQLKRGAGKGVEAAVRFLAARVKETLSVPAPKVAIRGVPKPGKKLGPIVGYRATAKAVTGAPPRMLSGRMRAGVTHKMYSTVRGAVGVHARSEPSRKYPEGFNYPLYHEAGKKGNDLGEGLHPYLLPTYKKYRRELRTIVGSEVRSALKRGGA